RHCDVDAGDKRREVKQSLQRRLLLFMSYENAGQGASSVIFSCLKAMPKRRMNSHSVISFFYLLILS
ncbi:hypothetical protein ACTXQV_32980, partial [Klebsiella pneumoniae]